MFTTMDRLLLLVAMFTTLWVGAATQSPIYVNVGGPNYSDVNGNLWISDKTPRIYNTGKAYKTLKTIENATNELQPVYQTERWTRKSSLQFDISIHPGDYLVRLLFAEVYFTSAGQRIFNVYIEDSLKYENLDIVSAAGGPYTALTMDTTTSVQDGVLSIRLDKVVQNPKLNGIAVLPWFGVDGFVFVNADTNRDVDDECTSCRDTSASLNLRANVFGNVSSVQLTVTGPENYHHTQVENVAPFAAFGDIDGDYFGHVFNTPGTYTVTARAFTEQNAQGVASTPFTSTFEIVPAEPFGIAGFVLVNADTNKEMKGALQCKPFVCLGNGKKFNIRAATFGHVKSVIFRVNGRFKGKQLEERPPYSLFGDMDGDYNGSPLPPGRYNVTAWAFRKSKARGESSTFTMTFEIVNEKEGTEAGNTVAAIEDSISMTLPTDEIATTTSTRTEDTTTTMKTPAPSPEPTPSPITPQPTLLPTSKPTPAPTSRPSRAPTPSPTPDPTLMHSAAPEPTYKPSSVPTSRPSQAPTPVPTPNPTPVPVTPQPTLLPTSKPTPVPTSRPSRAPTPSPAPDPTLMDSVAPEPTYKPSSVPTSRPSQAPTPVPTPNPTPVPVTPQPTFLPTNKPTRVPTSGPSQAPTPMPTPDPTPSPVTPNPTFLPTRQPTPLPTSRPSQAPTPAPSPGPTPAPVTPEPSPDPTPQPTPEPTPDPTLPPTPAPSPKPTPKPTPEPTLAPTPVPPTLPPPTPVPPTNAPPTPIPVQNGFTWDKNCVFNTETYDYCGRLELCSPSPGRFGYRQVPGGTCSSPGPEIRIDNGKRYVLTLVNNVPNTITNLHTHGLHISGDGNADDVTRYVEFNHQLHYVWDLSKGNHMGGTYWYHAHHHGETYNQVNYGALGMLIVNDDYDSLLPAGLTNSERIKTFLSNERSLFVHYVAYNSIFGAWYGNGKTDAQIDVVDGQWTRFRVAVSHAKASRMGLQITAVSSSEANPCVMHVIAHDGVYLNQVPSDQVSETTVTSASRVDLAVRCTSPGSQALLKVAYQVAATINVVAGSSLDATPFESGGSKWPPIRPNYLRDLRKEPVGASNKHGITLTSGDVNGKVWDPDVPLANLNYDQVQEFTIYDSGPHPFHMHLYHMQIVSSGGCGKFDYGEWYDTISAPGPCIVRFKTVDIGQRFVMHCHIIEHSDMGSMGWMDVLGGPTQSDQNPGVGQELVGTTTTTQQRMRRKLRGKERSCNKT